MIKNYFKVFFKFKRKQNQKYIEVFLNKKIDNICLSYRYDYAMMSNKEKTNLKNEAKTWILAVSKEFH